MFIAITLILLIILIVTFFCLLNSRKSKIDLTNEYLVWILFTVTLALLPLLFSWLNDYLNNMNPDFMEILSRGELFLIAALIGLDAADLPQEYAPVVMLDLEH